MTVMVNLLFFCLLSLDKEPQSVEFVQKALKKQHRG